MQPKIAVVMEVKQIIRTFLESPGRRRTTKIDRKIDYQANKDHVIAHTHTHRCAVKVRDRKSCCIQNVGQQLPLSFSDSQKKYKK